MVGSNCQIPPHLLAIMCPMGGHFFMKNQIKPAKTYDEQCEILEQKGIETDSSTTLLLSQINYYRFTGYIYPFLDHSTGTCNPRIPFSRIASIYNFDTEARSLIFNAIEKIETFLRTRLSYHFAHKYSPLGYLDVANHGTNFDEVKFKTSIERCIDENKNSPVIKHHINKYGGQFPIWVIIEYFTLGMLSHFYRNLQPNDKKTIAKSCFNTSYKKLDGWMRCITDLRNRCAHYSRLYNWNFTAIPSLSYKDIKIPCPENKNENTKITVNHKLFSQICLLKAMYPSDQWNNDFAIPFFLLLNKHANQVDLQHIGFPSDWPLFLFIK